MSQIDTYEPALICMGVIPAPLERVRDAVKSQLERTIDKNAFCSTLENINWREFFKLDGQFYDIMSAEIALFSPRENLTIYVCNLADGWASLYWNLVNACEVDAYFFRATLSEKVEYKVFEMMQWRRGILERQVRALQDDDRWKFLNKGNLLPFERVEKYKKREISARLDRKLIEGYSEAVGCNIASVTGFEGQCWRFSRCG